jgi:hypothetical protein
MITQASEDYREYLLSENIPKVAGSYSNKDTQGCAKWNPEVQLVESHSGS